MKFLKFLTLTLTINFCFQTQNVFSIDVIPEGKLIRESRGISNQSTVQMYFNANHPPVIKVTPGMLTLVQFPSEVRSCTSGTSLITITYGDKVSASNVTSNSSSSSGGASSGPIQSAQQGDYWYSAVFLNADGPSISKADSNDLINTPATDLICQIRISAPDSDRTEGFAWKIVGIKIASPEETYHVVYLLDENSSLNSNGLPSEKDLMENGDSYIDVKKLHQLSNEMNRINIKSKKNKENSDDDTPNYFHSKQRTVLTENLNENSYNDGASILKIYDFSKTKDRPASPKM